MSKALEEFMNAASKLSEAEARVSALEAQADEVEKSSKRLMDEAEKKARETKAEADKEAKARLFEVSKKEKALAAREKDVAKREDAVSWVDGKLEELKGKEKGLKLKEKLADEARAAASAEKELFYTKQNELNALADALSAKESAKVKKIMSKTTEAPKKEKSGAPTKKAKKKE